MVKASLIVSKPDEIIGMDATRVIIVMLGACSAAVCVFVWVVVGDMVDGGGSG